ncbi:MAG: hypothetical protein LBU67_03370 [Oscillospiraceae bacterium]|jgi:hypothetical protein|nr:hypothetical protein [Oscillospiraceae bacterium]
MPFARAFGLPPWQARQLPWLLLALALFVLAAPLGPVPMWAFAAALLGLCAAGSLAEATCAYLFISLFDSVLAFPPLGGSLVRVAQLGLLLRCGAQALLGWGGPGLPAARAAAGQRLPPGRLPAMRRAGLVFPVAAGGLALAFSLLSYALKGVTGDTLSFLFSLAVLLPLGLLLRGRGRELAGPLLQTYVAAALASVLLGLVYQRFFWMRGADFLGARFMGAHEPNFTAMFLDVGLLIYLAAGWPALAGGGRRRALSLPVRLADAAVMGTLAAGLLMTGSMTGLAVSACALLVFALRRRRAWRRGLARAAAGLAVAAGIMIACALILRPLPQGQVLAQSESTGYVSGESPNYIDTETYRAARRAGQPIEDLLLTRSQWVAQRQAQGLPVAQPLPAIVPTGPWSRLPVIGPRIDQAVAFLSGAGLDAATSGRLGLAREKLLDYLDYPWWQKLVGRGPDVEKTLMPMAFCLGYAHNSLLDMLCGFGLVGFAGLLWWLIRRARRGDLLGGGVGQGERAALRYARVALLLHALTLSMYLNRVFLFFFVL